MEVEVEQQLYSIREVSETLNVKEARIRRLIKQGTLKAQRVGWSWVIENSEVERLRRELS